MNKESRWLAVTVMAVLLLGVAVRFAWDWVAPVRIAPDEGAPAASARSNEVGMTGTASLSLERAGSAVVPADPVPEATPVAENFPPPIPEPAAIEPASRFRSSLDSDEVHFNEAVVLLNTTAGYQSFLAHAAGNATGKIPEILAVRVRAATARDIDAIIDTAFPQPEREVFNADLNWRMTIADSLSPVGPPVAQPVDVRRIIGITHEILQPPRLLEQNYGIENTSWGTRWSLALLDTGVAENTAPLRGRLVSLDIGWGIVPSDRHGTALATVAAGTRDLARGYMGVVPAARILGVRVTAPDGFSDVFSVAQGIVAAVNSGATVISVSPTSPYPAAVLTRAVAYATANPNGAVVAARSEDLKPSWPAMTPGAFSVIALDDLDAPVGPDGSTLRIVRAPVVIVPSVPGPDLSTLWVRLDAGPASATTMAAAMTAVFSLFPASTAGQVWTALHQNSADASFALRPEGEGFRLVFFEWMRGGDSSPNNNPAGAVPAAPPTGADAAAQSGGFIPGTTAVDPATGRPRVTVIRTGAPTGSARSGTPATGRAGVRGGASTTGAAGD